MGRIILGGLGLAWVWWGGHVDWLLGMVGYGGLKGLVV